MSDSHVTPKRAVCMHCLRPRRTCICSLAVPIRHATQILILQHPLEVHQAKGTARLLQLCLSHSRIVVGEGFEQETLHSLLYDPWPAASGDAQDDLPVQPVLLYPDSASGTSDASKSATISFPDADRRHRLAILDGTWRKSRKMLHCNPLLATLPRLGLAITHASRYAIRKAHRPEQLSTLEAACYALMQLEQDALRFQPLLHAFEEFVARQMQHAHAASGSEEGA